MERNAIREASDILHSRRGDEMTEEEFHLASTVLAFAANELPKICPKFEEMDLREILEEVRWQERNC